MRRIVFSDRAKGQINERDLLEELVIEAVTEPDEVLESRNRPVAHKLFEEHGRPYLLRVFYEDLDDQAVIVSVYKTSKVTKYRSAR